MTDIDLLSTVIHLQPAPELPPEDRPLPQWWGRAAHALLFQVIQAADPALSAALHQANNLRPFTVSNLMGRMPQGKLDPAGIYRLRFTALRSDVAAILWQAQQKGGLLAAGSELELDRIHFGVVEAPEGSHPAAWQAAASYQALSSAHLLAGQAPERRVCLLFTSPAVFKTKGAMQPLPLPGMVFGSLLNRWNDFAPLALPAELRRYAEECLLISRFNLRSRPAVLQENALRVGAVGQVTCSTINYDRYWMSLVHALAAFSLFAGVGTGTSMGLGQCRPCQMKAKD